jgi:energy-coupling factor transporter ATP-binding protein EcfA2
VKIKTLSLTDFRAFPGPAPATFELDGKNLLVYGENGSGKSSLFHALDGFFSPDQPPNLVGLRNSFSKAGIGNVRVEVGFDDSTSAAWHIGGADALLSYPTTSIIGPIPKAHHPGHDKPLNAKVTEAAKFSAVLDYRSLLDTNYRHEGRAINLFDLAVNGFLASYIDLATNKTIAQLWVALLASKPGRNTKKALARCLTARDAFNNAMRIALGLLLTRAKAILKILSPHGLELVSLPFTNVTYNGAKAWGDKNFTNQVLGLEVAYKGKTLEKPQHYLNEARQSALGLALYLGARLACAPAASPHLKLLVLDDVLVGLDHSNRLPVLEVLADLFGDWQVVLMTHDRGWFDLAYAKISPTDWCCYEIFEGDQSAPAPRPIYRSIPMDASLDRPARVYIDYAKHMVTLNYPEAAANYARQAMEATLRGGCEKQGIPIPFYRDPKKIKAQFLLDQLKHWPGNTKVTKVKLDPILAKVTLLKNVVMNPYSHPAAPNIPKSEVQQAISTVEELLVLIG